MTHAYQRLPDPGRGLRLHLNENTGGCSPRVLAAMRAVTSHEAAFYPDYSAVHRACAAYFDVTEDRLALTNGLDEGIHATSFGWLRRDADGAQHEAIIAEPAFDMYAACAEMADARLVQVMPARGFVFPLDDLLRAITPRTRVVFLASPNNPTGLRIAIDDLRAVARALPAGAVLFLDECYVDFARESFLPELAAHPNVIIGRTFAKAHGMAAVRAGAVIAAPEVIDRIRFMLPPYSVNVFAIAGLLAAVEDRDHLAWYKAQVAESKRLVYDACDRLGLPYWVSEANFVLIRVGARAAALVEAAASRGVFIRDRSSEPGCAGCIRLTAGIVEHTREALAAIEETLCDAP